MLKQMIFDFCDKEIHVLENEPIAANDLPAIVQTLEKAASLGLCGIAIEEKYNGSNLDFNTGLLYMEAFAYGFSFATTIGTHVSIGSLPIVYYGNDYQKEKYLPKIATAEIKTAYALTEPSSGSDANSGRTKAIINEEKKCYMLTGQKMWITNSGFADLFIVFAKIEDDEKLSAFIVEKDFWRNYSWRRRKKTWYSLFIHKTSLFLRDKSSYRKSIYFSTLKRIFVSIIKLFKIFWVFQVTMHRDPMHVIKILCINIF